MPPANFVHFSLASVVMSMSISIRTSAAAILIAGWMIAGGAQAADTASSKTVGGLTVYLAVLPAAMIRGETEEHVTEAHGKVPRGSHVYHVMAAVFDADSGLQLDDASVEARVTPLGLAPVIRELEPMVVAGAVTYGNYFTMRGDGLYRIAFTVNAKGRSEPVSVEFSYQHRTQ